MISANMTSREVVANLIRLVIFLWMIALILMGCREETQQISPPTELASPNSTKLEPTTTHNGTQQTSVAPTNTITQTSNLNIYQYANGCYRLSIHGQWLTADHNTFKLNSSSTLATPFYAKATHLGKYLLYAPDASYFSSQTSNFRTTELTENNIWEFSNQNQSLRIKNTNQQWLTETHGQLSLTQDPSQAAPIIAESATDCLTFPEATLNAIGTPSGKSWEDGSVYGVADVHAHMFHNLGMGGRIIHGSTFHPLGVQKALDDAKYTHGEGAYADLLPIITNSVLSGDGNILDKIIGASNKKPTMKDTRGWPIFAQWPKAGKTGSQTMYYRWVERAYLSGVRLLGVEIVSMGVFCRISHFAWPVVDPDFKNLYSCNEQESADLQTAAAFQLQDYIDAQHGGPNRGWFRIVKTPQEARQVIQQGKLAVVLSYEMDNPFDCYMVNQNCTPEYIRQQVRRSYDLGIRSMFIAHSANNAMSGTTANTGPFTNFMNMLETGQAYEFELCKVPYNPAFAVNASEQGLPSSLNMLKSLLDFSSLLTGKRVTQLLPIYPNIKPACNKRGLTPVGEAMIKEMMRLGMIIQLDHISENAYYQALPIFYRYNYPWSHDHAAGNSPDSLAMMKDIAKYGGYYSNIPGNAYHTMVRYVLPKTELLKSLNMLPALGYTTDSNGAINMPSARKPSQNEGPATKIQYPFTSYDGEVTFMPHQLGQRLIDFEQEGWVTYGQFAELFEDMKQMGYTKEQMKPLFYSAEAYIRTWEKAVARSKALQGQID